MSPEAWCRQPGRPCTCRSRPSSQSAARHGFECLDIRIFEYSLVLGTFECLKAIFVFVRMLESNIRIRSNAWKQYSYSFECQIGQYSKHGRPGFKHKHSNIRTEFLGRWHIHNKLYGCHFFLNRHSWVNPKIFRSAIQTVPVPVQTIHVPGTVFGIFRVHDRIDENSKSSFGDGRIFPPKNKRSYEITVRATLYTRSLLGFSFDVPEYRVQ